MRKLKEVLRLKYDQKMSNRQIASVCKVARSTVADYVSRAEAAKLIWPLPAEIDESKLEAQLFPEQDHTRTAGKKQPDFKAIDIELRRHKHVTLQLLWQEYKQSEPAGYQYSQFCELYRSWSKKSELVLRQSHRAGEKLFVDYAGQTVPVMNVKTREVIQASIFVAVLGASNYTYAEASYSQGLECWLNSHVRAFEYIGGCPAVVVPDNLKSGVNRSCRYEPELNASYQELAEHYSIAVMPARPYKPRDKAKVEVGVQVVERWVLAALRHQQFFSLEELNQAIAELIERLNDRPFKKLPGSRAELFEQLDRPALKPLPVDRYEYGEWKHATVNIDYHVEYDRHYYSAPHRLTGRKVDLRCTANTIELFLNRRRVASHARSYQAGAATTIEEHRPEGHQRYMGWTPSRLVSWAGKTGPATAEVVNQILQSSAYPEQRYRSCLGLLRLGDRYGQDRLEAASERALQFQICSYKSVKSILEKRLDRLTAQEQAREVPALQHDNIRGANYFEEEEPDDVD